MAVDLGCRLPPNLGCVVTGCRACREQAREQQLDDQIASVLHLIVATTGLRPSTHGLNQPSLCDGASQPTQDSGHSISHLQHLASWTSSPPK